MMIQTQKCLYFCQKSFPGVSVFGLVVLLEATFIQLLEVRPGWKPEYGDSALGDKSYKLCFAGRF